MTFVSYRKTQIKDQNCKKFCKFWNDWIEINTYNLLPHWFKNISMYCQKDLAPLSKGGDLYIHYMIKFNIFISCNVCPFHLFILFVNVERYSNRSINSKFHNYYNMFLYNFATCVFVWMRNKLFIELKNHLYNHSYKLGIMDICI